MTMTTMSAVAIETALRAQIPLGVFLFKLGRTLGSWFDIKGWGP
jgi:hypothetical protein